MQYITDMKLDCQEMKQTFQPGRKKLMTSKRKNGRILRKILDPKLLISLACICRLKTQFLLSMIKPFIFINNT